MAVPRIFSNLPDGLSLPLFWFDDDFVYVLAQIATRQVGLKLTTVGNSGAATLGVDGTLNIPNYSGIGGAAVIVTTAGPFAPGASDSALILNKAAPSATVVNLPAVATRNGAPLIISDFAGNAGPITLNANGAETIMGLASAILASGPKGVGTAASLTLYPSVALGGWYRE